MFKGHGEGQESGDRGDKQMKPSQKSYFLLACCDAPLGLQHQEETVWWQDGPVDRAILLSVKGELCSITHVFTDALWCQTAIPNTVELISVALQIVGDCWNKKTIQ